MTEHVNIKLTIVQNKYEEDFDPLVMQKNFLRELNWTLPPESEVYVAQFEFPWFIKTPDEKPWGGGSDFQVISLLIEIAKNPATITAANIAITTLITKFLERGKDSEVHLQKGDKLVTLKNRPSKKMLKEAKELLSDIEEETIEPAPSRLKLYQSDARIVLPIELNIDKLPWDLIEKSISEWIKSNLPAIFGVGPESLDIEFDRTKNRKIVRISNMTFILETFVFKEVSQFAEFILNQSKFYDTSSLGVPGFIIFIIAPDYDTIKEWEILISKMTIFSGGFGTHIFFGYISSDNAFNAVQQTSGGLG